VLVPAGVLGLTALIDALRTRFSLRALWAVAAIFIVWNTLLMGQYVLRLVPNEGPVNSAALVRNQFTLLPNHVGHLLRAVAGRERR